MTKRTIPQRINRRECRDTRGFTFFEVMITAAILATGTVMIYKALLLSMDYQSHMVYRLHALNLIDHKIASVQQHYQTTGEIPVMQGEEVERILLNNKAIAFRYRLDFNSVGDLEDIFRLDLNLSWLENGRSIQLNRSAYIFRIPSESS